MLSAPAWLVAVPIVILGAPFGAFCASVFKRETIIIMLLVLIAIMALAALSVGFWVGVRRIRSPGPGERSEVDSD